MLQLSTSKDQLALKQIELNILKLFPIYGKAYAHEAHNEAKESRKGITMLICYPAKLNCTENELVAKYNSVWQLMMKVWLDFKGSTPKLTLSKFFCQ